MADSSDTCTCGQPIENADKMAQCSQCLRHIHHSCVVVLKSADMERNMCASCLDREPAPSRSLSNSTSRARILLDLKRLEEEKLIQEKAAEEKIRREKDFLGKKYELLYAQLADEDDAGSVRSHRSVSSIQKVHQRLQEDPVANASSGIGCNKVPAGTVSRTGTIPKQTRSDLGTAASSSTPLSGKQPGVIIGLTPRQPANRGVVHWRTPEADVQADQVTPENQTQNPLDWSLDWDGPAVPYSAPTGQLAVDLHEIQKRFRGLQLGATKQTQLSTEAGDAQQPEPTSSVPQKIQVMPKISVSHSGQFPSLEIPALPSNQLTSAAPVSQTRTSIKNTIPLIERNVTTQSNKVTFDTPKVSSLLQHTHPATTKPCLPPLPLSSTVPAFNPLHISTPNVQPSSAPSVPLMNDNYLPISSSFRQQLPNVQTVQSNQVPVVTPAVAPTGPATANPPIVPTSESVPPPQWIGIPTSQQLAARHIVPKDLPTFSGDPVEWPLFLSCFQNSTELCGFSDGENLMRLQRSLKGNALEAVRSYLLHPSSVPMIIATLRTLYGRPDLIINSLLQKVRATPAPKPEKLETLVGFGLACQNLCSHLRAAGQQAHFSNPALLQELVNKLPANIKLDWALFKQKCRVVDLSTFGDYMAQIVVAASDVTPFQPSDDFHSSKQDNRKGKEKLFVNTHSSSNQLDTGAKQPAHSSSGGKQYSPKPCPICQKLGHKVRDCNDFKSCSLEDRWKRVQEHYLCRRCLVAHGKFPCKASGCGMEGCEERHHKLLHPGKPQSTTTANQSKDAATVNVHRNRQISTLFRILPVMLFGNNKSIETYAFLDEGSSTTLVDAQIARELGVTGEVQPLCLQWTSDVERSENDSQLIRLEISGRGAEKRHVLKTARTVEKLGLPSQSLPFKQLANLFPYLRGLPVQAYSNATPAILIGLDNMHLKIPLKIREGKVGQPAASKTRLGWTVYGEVPGAASSEYRCQLHSQETQNPDDKLHNLVKEFFSVENVGVAVVPLLEGSDEKRSRQILEDTTVRLPSGRFQTGLLWKYDQIKFPDSKPMAEQRLKSLERRLVRSPELYENVKNQLIEYVDKGYAHKITQDELFGSDPNRVWYLPLGIVVHPKKPNKVRLVWDAAATVRGQSLNSALLAGPDLLTPLPSVLSRYRQRQVAISGDVKEMFHQYEIRPEDKQAQRFVFRDDPSKNLDIYVMDVGTFGATCSPSSAQFIKNRNAKDFEDQYPKAAVAIVDNHYVDDYLDSLDTIDEAVELALQVKTVHAKAGFHIRNWMSSSKDVLARVGDSADEPVKCFKAHNSSTSERVLGMSWLPETDEFVFTGLFREELAPVLQGDIVPTKRQLLQVVMSIFDPLGLVSLFVVHGKILIQNVWRCNIGWDEEINNELFGEWRRWIRFLEHLDTIRIPRCYFPGYSPESYDSLELHIFVDASEEAYVAAAYFRIVDRGQVRCALVSSKTKVAPLKPLSVPRLELQAALLGARLAKSVEENHSLRIKQRIFWSDSSTVLAWLKSDQRKYRQFVAFRVAEILDTTTTGEWRHVPSRWNVADDATKWKDGLQLDNNHRWFHGPEFLQNPPAMWPQHQTLPTETTEELRPVHIHREIIDEPLVNFRRFSKWERCQRTFAYVHRFIDQLKRKRRRETTSVSELLTREELQRAEATICRLAQFEEFADEVVLLRRNQQLPPAEQHRLQKTSKLFKLSAFLDKQGVVRMEGRIAGFSDGLYDFKYPIVLPKNHYVTQLIVDWYHRQYRHCNGETAVNEMRQKFHVSEMRAAFRKAGKCCTWCKVYKAVPRTPRMAPLPEARITPYVRPFSFVGLDYFGPLQVTQGRRVVKRWVALFTCLTIRAIHLEAVSSLSTECCKMAIRRFIARRGAPSEIYSDRGTNFVGVSRELRQQIRGINENLATTFTNTVTQWRFNPPSAPHMGGSWERMVRSVKCALASLSNERKPDEETLVTLLVEAESLVNSRPLTYMPLETAEHEALTPNCFLMLSTSGVNQRPSQLDGTKSTLRSSWKLYQRLLDQFWSRWIKEYLPTITKRTKWFVDTKPVEAGDLVIIVDDHLRNGWTRGQVLRVFMGRDGRSRSADVKTSTGIFRRPVAKLAVLEVADTARRNSEQYGSGNVQDALTAVFALVEAASLSPENNHHHYGGSNFHLQRYATAKGRPPPPRLMSRADNMVPLNNQTLDRNRRLIPYMTFYIPSSNGDFSLPINQAYNYMPIRQQRPQEPQQSHMHHSQHGGSKQQILSLQQYQRHPQQQSGLGGDPPLVYQSYQPQIHQSTRYQSSSSASSSPSGSSQGNPFKTILINNTPIKYEYSHSHRHQLAPSPSSSSSGSSSNSGSGGGRDPNLAFVYNARPQLQQQQQHQHQQYQQQQQQSPPSKLYAIDIQPPATIPKPQPSILPNGFSSSSSSSNSGGESGLNLLTATPTPQAIATRSPIKYQPAAVYKKYQINPFLPSNKLPGAFTPLAYNNGAPNGQHIVQDESEEEQEQEVDLKPFPRPTPSSTYSGLKLQTTYVLVKPSPEPNQLYYHEKPARPSTGSGSYATYKEKPSYHDDQDQVYKPKPIPKPSYDHELEIYKTLPKPVSSSKPSYLEEHIIYKPAPKPISIHKPSYLDDSDLYRPVSKPIPVPIPVAVEYSTPRNVPQRVEYSTPRPHPASVLKENYSPYIPLSGSTPAPKPSTPTTHRPKYSARQKPQPYKHHRASTKAPPVRQHLTESLNPTDIRSPNPNYFEQQADYKPQVKQNFYSQGAYIPLSKPIKTTKLIAAHHEEKLRPVYQHNTPANPYPQSHPVSSTQIIDSASASGSTSLADLLKKLQDSNHLPKTLTPDNIDNSIRTLVKILNNLKASQQVHQQPEQEFTTEEYDHHPVAPVKSPKPTKKPASHHHHHDDDDDDSGAYMPHHPELGPTPPGPNSGRPGVDYPNYSQIPETSFTCKEQRYKGFFGDPETNCQVWHYCDLNGGKASFLCPNGTIFSQVALTCDWWFNVKCSTTAQLYVLNERLYKYILPFTPKFPEDYSGPLVDKYLAIKFQEMEEKMQKQRSKGKPVVKPSQENENDELNGNKLEDNDTRYNQNQPYPVQYVTENSIEVTAPSAAGASATTPITLEDINAEYDRAESSGTEAAPDTGPGASMNTPQSAPIVVTAPSAPASSTGAEEDDRADPVTVLAETIPPPRYGSKNPTSVRPPPGAMQALREVRIEVKNDGTSGHLTPNHHGYGEERRK